MKKRHAALIILIAWLPLFIGAWNAAKPAATTSLRSSNPEILANNTALESAIGANHEFSTGGTNSGKHTTIVMEEQASITTGANEMGLYCADLGTAPGLYLRPQSNGTAIQWSDISGKVVNAAMAADSIDSAQYVDGSIDAGHYAADSIDEDDIRLANDSYLTGRNNAGNGDINIIKVNTSDGITLGAVTTLPDTSVLATSGAPTADAQIANKKYIDDQLASEGIQAWVVFDGDGATGAKTPTASYNITSVNKDGTGKYTITWATNFSSANYAVVGMAGGGTQAVFVMAEKDNASWCAAGSAQIDVVAHGGAFADAPFVMVMAIGGQ